MNQPKSLYEKILQAEKQSTVEEIINRENSKRIRVHMPCKVIDIHDNTVDVEIQGMEDTGFGYYSKFPVLLDLPIIYNNYTNSAYIITPVQKGDTGLVEFLDFNSSMFNQDGNTGITLDNYYHSLNNGVFINGFIPNSKHIDIPINKPIVIGLKNQTFSLEVGDNGEPIFKSLNTINFSSPIGITLDTPEVNCTGSLACNTGASGVFQAGDKSVTVLNGIIVSIE